MKIITIFLSALFAACAEGHRHHHKQHHPSHNYHQHKSFPDNLGDKNSETEEENWAEYHDNRPKEHDCSVNERYNWYGNHRCRFSWECKGARLCEKHIYNDPSLSGIGWCRGPDACPMMGPLDRYEED